MVNLIDTHAHLYAEEFDNDLKDILSNAADIGVKKILLPNIDETTMQKMVDLCRRIERPECIPMIGLHPCSVRIDYKAQLDSIFSFSNQAKYCAVGEIGMDLHWDKSTQDIQSEAFIWQVEKAIEMDLPIAIHSRKASLEVIELLQAYKGKIRGVFHCFGDDLDTAIKILDLGFLLGIGGVLTFKNSGLDRVLETIDLKHLILETDAPYLAPTPHRGKRNEPAYTWLIAKKLAEIKNSSVEEVGETTSKNAQQLFGV
jgi:TatD DNase family protein